MITIHQVLTDAVSILKENNINTPRLDGEVILAHLLDCKRIDLILKHDEVLDKEQEREYIKRINLRAQGMPVQYITGNQEFMGLDFHVTPDVLIPRPDTEILVEEAIQEASLMDKPLIIVEIGTGSGAIALSLAHYIKDAQVHTIDISPKAIAIAKKNAKKLSLEEKVIFHQGDLLSPIKGILDGKVDILVSNPPYIPSKDILSLQREVQFHEPSLALDGGIEGLDFYKRIIDEVLDFLSHQARLIFEIGHDQGDRVSGMIREMGIFSDIRIIKDLASLDRVV
ncbi:MAG TPA: peptide chain release factor N(5)-glutamine methyltransferase, partial [Eubacteriaceae bacterium]|nr:peptide chain release factor N(5)-glutamine methyltransferase [Eubacteriaceae bacterium]